MGGKSPIASLTVFHDFNPSVPFLLCVAIGNAKTKPYVFNSLLISFLTACRTYLLLACGTP